MSISYEKVKTIMSANNICVFGFHPFLPDELPLRKCSATDKMQQFFTHTAEDENCRPPNSILTLLIPYDFPKLSAQLNQPNICRYARIPDYHYSVAEIAAKIISDFEKVLPQYRFISFVDNSPFYEAPLAACSGLGVIGDNGLLISENYGSYVFIATIVTNYDFSEYFNVSEIKRCIKCGACKKACPASCIGDDSQSFLAEKCLSAITQKKGDISAFSEKEIALIRDNNTAWGCDICAEVCPMNLGKEKSPHPALLKHESEYIECLSSALLDSLLIAEKPVLRAWDWRGDKVIRRNLRIISKNKEKKLVNN